MVITNLNNNLRRMSDMSDTHVTSFTIIVLIKYLIILHVVTYAYSAWSQQCVITWPASMI